jgi:hypothetical protein
MPRLLGRGTTKHENKARLTLDSIFSLKGKRGKGRAILNYFNLAVVKRMERGTLLSYKVYNMVLEN